MGGTVTDLQILGCELHQNASGGRAPPAVVWRSPKPPSRSHRLPSHYYGEGRVRKGRKGLGIGKEGKGVGRHWKGAEQGRKGGGKGEGN